MITTTMLPLFVAPFTMNRSLPISDNDLNLGRHEAQLGSKVGPLRRAFFGSASLFGNS
jgi:hypothetical protein